MNGLAGTLRLVGLAARRDRITLPVWILSLTGFLAVTTFGTASISVIGAKSFSGS